MCTGGDQLSYSVRFLSSQPSLAFAASVLSAVVSHRGTFDIILISHQDYRILLGDNIFVSHLTQLMIDDLGPPGIAQLLFHLCQFTLDDIQNLLLIGQDCPVFGNLRQQFSQLILDRLAIQPGQLTQLHG